MALYPVLMLGLDCAREFVPGLDAEFFASLPTRPGVLLIEMREPGAEPYLVRTADVRRAAERLLSVPEQPTKRLNLREVAARVRYRLTGSKFEQALTHYQQARAHFPARYREIARIRPPAVLKVNLRSDYPRCYVTRKIRRRLRSLFRPVRFPQSRGCLRRSLSGPLQDSPVPDQNPARSDVSRLYLFGNENVPRTVFRGLHESGI